jgi:hypothetical protein
MKKRSFLMVGAVLITAAALVLGGCGGGSPEKIQAQLEKLQAEALALTESGEAGDMLKAAKLTTEAVKLMAELEKVQTKAAEKPAKSSGGGKEIPATAFHYELNKAGDGVVITGIQGDAALSGNVVIPAKIEGYPVVKIQVRGTFLGSSRITSVVFPDSIEIDLEDKIHQQWGNVFEHSCTALKSITPPKNMKVIPDGFTDRCENLTTVNWPEGLEAIGELRDSVGSDSAFAEAGFTGELVIPEGVKTIGYRAFRGCKNLTSITIPDSVETIGESAFRGLPLLTTVKMPAKTIKYPGSKDKYTGAFSGNSKLLSIAVRKAIQDTGYKSE